MKVNSVTLYNNTLQNRKNVKFGDCKKVVCEEAMIKAQKAFENNKTWKPALDKLYDYEVHFISDMSLEHSKISNYYTMILSPCEHLSPNVTKGKENLPTSIFVEANSLEDSHNIIKYHGPKGFNERTEEIEYGLISKINNYTLEEILKRINNATKESKIVHEEKTTRE